VLWHGNGDGVLAGASGDLTARSVALLLPGVSSAAKLSLAISAELFRREVVDRPTGPNGHGRDADLINSRLDDRGRRDDGICSQRDCASLDLELDRYLVPPQNQSPAQWTSAGLRQRTGARG
jgi:hypothetical protein